MCEMTGYKPQTTFWDDFMIAEKFGIDAVRDTYNRVMRAWSDNYIYLTELVMVLNWNIWYWNGAGTSLAEKFTELYNELWEKTHAYSLDNLTGDELQYYLRTVD